MQADGKKIIDARGKLFVLHKGQLVRVSTGPKKNEDITASTRSAATSRAWRFFKPIIWQTLKVGGAGSAVTAVSFWGAAQLEFSPDGFGAVLVCFSGLSGAFMAWLDKRPKSSEKISALQIKRDSDFCGLLAAVLGFPSVVAKVFAPAAGTHDFGSMIVTISAFILSYAVVLKFRSSHADYERERLKSVINYTPDSTPIE